MAKSLEQVAALVERESIKRQRKWQLATNEDWNPPDLEEAGGLDPNHPQLDLAERAIALAFNQDNPAPVASLGAFLTAAKSAPGGLGALAIKLRGLPSNRREWSATDTKAYKAELRSLERMTTAGKQKHRNVSAARAERIRAAGNYAGVGNPLVKLNISIGVRGDWTISNDHIKFTPFYTNMYGHPSDLSDILEGGGGGFISTFLYTYYDENPNFNPELDRVYGLMITAEEAK